MQQGDVQLIGGGGGGGLDGAFVKSHSPSRYTMGPAAAIGSSARPREAPGEGGARATVDWNVEAKKKKVAARPTARGIQFCKEPPPGRDGRSANLEI